MNTETPAADTLKKDIQTLLGQLKTVRDEIKLEIHLASMDARDAWKKLEPDFDQAVTSAKQANRTSREAAQEALQRFKAFREEVRKQAQARK